MIAIGNAWISKRTLIDDDNIDKRKNWRGGGRAIRHWENGLGREKWKDKIGKDVKPLNHVEVGEVKDEEGGGGTGRREEGWRG